MPGRIEIYHHHSISLGAGATRAELEAAMSEIRDTLDQIKAAIDAARARVAEDVDELKRIIADSQMTDDDRATSAAILDSLAGFDPVPEFPAPPDDGGDEGGEPEPEPEPEPEG